MNDRQLIERLILPAMMQTVVIGFARSLGDDAGVLEPVQRLLTDAMNEVVADIPPDRTAKLVRRAKRITTEAMAPIGGLVIGVQYLAVARLVADLAEQDVIVIGAESPFAKAWDLMAEVIGLGWDQLEAQDGQAQAVAQDMRRLLEMQGFYQGAL